MVKPKLKLDFKFIATNTYGDSFRYWICPFVMLDPSFRICLRLSKSKTSGENQKFEI